MEGDEGKGQGKVKMEEGLHLERGVLKRRILRCGTVPGASLSTSIACPIPASHFFLGTPNRTLDSGLAGVALENGFPVTTPTVPTPLPLLASSRHNAMHCQRAREKFASDLPRAELEIIDSACLLCRQPLERPRHRPILLPSARRPETGSAVTVPPRIPLYL
jgi:hypothetical protein